MIFASECLSEPSESLLTATRTVSDANGIKQLEEDNV